ncbi:MAG TPA: ABC transporter ATP-binding protein [Rubrobacteraceae bacterium]|nr:ABC transporter ATP-binding protein [Rubrobacteraceae bacterium]
MQVEIKDLKKVFSGQGNEEVEALAGIDLSITEGEFVSIVGPSGCGKSTLMEIVGGLTEPTGGEVLIDGEPINGPHPAVGLVFQQESAFPWRSVLGNVEFGLEMHGTPKEERRQRSRDLIELVGLQGFEDRYPEELSGGMRQRVAIARTLVMNPQVLLMDEPFGALDEQTRLILGDELLRIWSQSRATALFITHSIEEAVLLSDRVIVMSARPGSVKKVVPVDLERPRDSSVFGTPEFGRITGEIWEVLREESMKALKGQV